MKQMQPQDKAIHDMLTAQSTELRQFLDFLEKKDNLQNISLKRTQDQVNQNTVNIFGLQESIKRIEQQMNSQTIKQLEEKINTLEEKMDLVMIPPKKIIDESVQEQIQELSKMLQDVQNYLWAQITALKNQSQKDYSLIKTDLEQLYNQIKNFEPIKPQMNTQKFQITDFYQATEQIYIANISDQNKYQTQFEFIVEDDEQPFSIGIIQDGDLEYQDSKIRFLAIQFPSGQLIRGAEDPINFLPRQFLRNDRVQMKVLKEKELFMVTLNGIDIPPIKIKEVLSNQHAFVIKSEYPLQDIIFQDDEY